MTISRRALLAAIATLPAMQAGAHALPDSRLTLWREGETLRLDLVMPLHELLLAMNPASHGHGKSPDDKAIAAYVAAHMRFETNGVFSAPVVSSVLHGSAQDPDVGRYETVTVAAALDHAANPMVLHLDVITHQVRNHGTEVLMRTVDGKFQPVGIARYDLATKMILPVAVPAS